MLERTLDGYRDSDTVSEAARDLARQLAERSYGVVVVEPGDMTRYEVHVTLTDHGTVVALPDFGVAARLSLGYLTAAYVDEKLAIGGRKQSDPTVWLVTALLTLTGEDYRRITAPDEALGTDGKPLFEVVAAMEYDAEHDTLG